MEPLSWATIAGLIIKIGIPATDFIIRQWQSGKAPTAEDWAKAMELGQQTPEGVLSGILASKGISQDDPRAKELLALINAKP